MNEIKVTVLGSDGVGKSECVYRKRLSVDGRQVNLELYDSCSQACEGKSTLNDQIHWADGFIVVYDISDRSSFLTAKAIVHLIRDLHLGSAKRDVNSPVFLVGNKQDLCHMREVQREEAQSLAAEFHCQFYELSAAEHSQEVALIFSKVVQNAGMGVKARERRRRPSGSKSMAKLINNVFGKRRKSV
ncbi:ras-related and estrogen-regulated growth inhibitor-like protein isoform X2 [Pempheris klunzingeri]|uniref:ras-related and estrogen-regulated growth inhibitor-like protein isoform X2 n=1 Tax=Pempheris klunzingeri TaxID=3127111 RepID=UPI0039814795